MTQDIFSAVGNEVRAKLILCLAEKPKNVTDLICNCGLSQSAVSQHLAKLKESGIVECSKKGKEMWYSLKDHRLADVCRLLLSIHNT